MAFLMNLLLLAGLNRESCAFEERNVRRLGRRHREIRKRKGSYSLTAMMRKHL